MYYFPKKSSSESQNSQKFQGQSTSQQKIIKTSSKITLQTSNSSLVLRNTEYLTQLQNFLTYKISYKQIDIEQFYEAIDIIPFCKLIVQNLYLLQICYLCKMKLYLSQSLYVQKSKYLPTLHNINFFQFYCFQNDLTLLQIGISSKKLVLNKKFHKIFHKQQQQMKMKDIFMILEKLVGWVQNYFQNIKYNQKMNLNINNQTQLNRKYLIQFVKACRKLILPDQKRFQSPKQLLQILQNTKLFRCHSILVKILNCSLFYAIKSSRQVLQKLNFSIKSLNSILIMSQQQKFKHQKQVFRIIDKFFTYLCKANIVQINKSLKNLSEDIQNAQDSLSLFDYQTQTTTSVISASLLVSQKKYLVLCQQLLQKIFNNENLGNCLTENDIQPIKNLEVQILYTYETNQIKVRCITQIQITIQNMDFLNYLIALFNQNMKSSMFVDTIQKYRKSASKRKEKVIIFRLAYKSNPTQEPLTKMIELIGISILAAKIFTAELSKKSFIKLQEYEKKEMNCQIFRHYEEMFRNIVRRFFQKNIEK